MYKLDLKDVQRYVDDLDDPSREAFDTAIRSTIHYMLGIRDGACYRYESDINKCVKTRRFQSWRGKRKD